MNKITKIILKITTFVILGGLITGTIIYLDRKDLENYCTVKLVNIHGEIQKYIPINSYEQNSTWLPRKVMINAVSFEDVKQELRLKNNNAYIFAIDSKEGDILTGKSIADLIQELDRQTFSIIGKNASPAGYLAASGANIIYALENSVLSGIGPQEKLDSSTKEILISAIANNRNISIEQSTKFVNGGVYTAQQAKDLGLIDEIGGYSDVKRFLSENVVWNVHTCE